MATFSENLAALEPPSETGIVRKYYSADEINLTPGERSFVAWVSTEAVDHVGDVVVASGIDYKSVYLKNPVILAVHDDGQWPIGQCEWLKVKSGPQWKGLFGKGLIDDTPDTQTVWAKMKSRTVRGVSIQFKGPEDMQRGEWGPPTAEEVKRNPEWKGAKRIIRRCVMLEFSVCPIPMNPGALIEAVAKGLHPMAKSLEQPMSDDASADDKKTTDEHSTKAIIAKTIAKVLTVDQLESKGVALGSMAGSMSASAVLDRLNGMLTTYLWNLLWNNQGTPEEIADKCRKGCDEFCDSFIAAATALLPLNEKSLEDAVDAVAKAYDPDADNDDDEADPDESDEGPIRKGHCVKCVKGSYKGLHGKVASVHRSGFVPDVEDNVMGTKDDPGIRLHAHKAMGDGHVPTDHHVGVKMSHCEKCNELKPPKRKGLNPSKAANIEILPSEVRTDEQVQAERIAAIRATLNDPNYVQSVVKATIEQMQGVI